MFSSCYDMSDIVSPFYPILHSFYPLLSRFCICVATPNLTTMFPFFPFIFFLF